MIDLNTGTFRPSTADDYVSRSVAYFFPEHWDQTVMQELEVFIGQIYPLEAEKALMQR